MTYNADGDMLREARAQAQRRANREGLPMVIWKDGSGRWYVRSEAEGAPMELREGWRRAVETVQPEAVTP